MTFEEIIKIAKIAIGLGISRIKLTGGEPLMRKDLCKIIKGIAATPNLKDLSMTTNGTLLGDQAQTLYDCGLRRVNVSLPTLNDGLYHKLTEGRIADALDGIKAAVKAGLFPVKINMVLLNQINVEEVPEMIRFARETSTILQLIELDPVNVDANYYSVYHTFLDKQEALLKEKALKIETRRFMQNRHIYHLPAATVEIVHPIENRDFCMHCTRLRVTSSGKLKPCLMGNKNAIDIITPLRKGASDRDLERLFVLANEIREPYNKP